MDFLAIIGDPGAGKTNMLVRYLYNEYRSGTKIVSNMESLKFPQTHMGFDEFLLAIDREDPLLRDCIVGTDELGIAADSYDFLSPKNRGLVKFNTQRRKFHIRWIYTVQRFGMITRRLRLLTEGFVSMTDPDRDNMHYPDGRKAKSHRDVCQGIFNADFFDRDMRFIKSRSFNGRKYWPLYDTDERQSYNGESVSGDSEEIPKGRRKNREDSEAGEWKTLRSSKAVS